MSERKVLNKYYPPDFDPSKIPKLRFPKNRQYSIRIMAPFNMRCNTCGEYIYKGKKFNSRKETVEDEDYLGLKIFRFYIKCPRCVAEIAFKTDPQNTDYSLEGGATRNFEAMRTAEMLAKKEMQEKEQEELNNPMKVLENRTKASQQEMEMIETLEELRDMNSRHAKVDHDSMVKLHRVYEEQLKRLQDEEDERFIKEVFGTKTGDDVVKRVNDEVDDPLLGPPPNKKASLGQKPTDLLTTEVDSRASDATRKPAKPAPNGRTNSTGISSQKSLLGLVRRKGPSITVTDSKTPQISTLVAANAKSTPASDAAPAGSEKSLAEKTPDGASSQEPTTHTTTGSTAGAASGLGLLGAYSDSDSDASSD